MGITNYIRRQFKNGVSIADTVPAGFSSGATSFSAADGTSFPDGSIGPFIITADQGLTTEEKILVASRSGAVFTVAVGGRGYNGTAAAAHAAGCSILHTIDAQDMDEANQTMAQTIGAIAAKGDLLVGSAANTLTKLAVGSAAQTLQVVSGTLSYVGFGSGQSQNVGASNADGTQTTYARSDHVHSGVTSFNGSGGAITAVGSFNTRTGSVVAGNADYLAVSTGGLTGAVAATRYVGGTASGAPSAGTFATGDFVIDQSGVLWICTTGGTPGTWQTSRPVGNPVARAHQTSLTTIGSAFTAITNTTSDFTLGGITYGSNAFTVPVAGYYQCYAQLDFSSSSISDFQCSLIKNSSQVVASTGANPQWTTTALELTVAANDIIHCAANDTLSWGGLSSAGNINTSPGNSRVYMTVQFVSQ